MGHCGQGCAGHAAPRLGIDLRRAAIARAGPGSDAPVVGQRQRAGEASVATVAGQLLQHLVRDQVRLGGRIAGHGLEIARQRERQLIDALGAVHDLGGQQLAIGQPVDPLNRGRGTAGHVQRLARIRRREYIEVPAGGALIGHEPADEGDLRAVRRPARDRNLQAVERPFYGDRIEDRLWLRAAGAQRLGVKLRHPPVVLTRRRRGHVGQLRRVGRPVELIHVQSRGRGFGQLPGRGVDRCHALNFEALDPDDPGGRLHRRQGAGWPGRALDIEQAQRAPIRGPGQLVREAVQRGELAHSA